MAKDKKGSKAVASAPAVSKPLESVKAGRVSKPIEKVKTTAKDATKKAAKGVKKSAKKVEKQVSSSESSSESHAGTSASSASSDDESEKEVKIKQEPKSKGAAAAPAAKQSKDTSDSDSDSLSSESDKEPAPKKAKAPKANGAAKSVAKKDDSSSDSDSSSDTGDDEKATTPKVNGKAEAGSDSSDSDSGSESDSSSDDEGDAKVGAEKGAKAADDDDSSDDSSSSDEEEEKVAKVAPAAKKRKAEEVIDQTPKKTKVAVNGEQKDAVSNLFVGNLSWNVDEEWLTREFEEFGELTGVRVITDRESGRSKGFGYVEFAEVDSAVQAIEAKQGAMVDNRNIRIDFSNPRPDKSDGATPQQRSSDRAQRYGDTPKEPSTTLFVGNVSFDADETMISELFQEYGTITSVRLPTDRESGSLKGFGYVDFTSIEEAQGAFDALQGADVAGRPIRLDYASQRSNNTDSPRGGFGGRGGGRGRGDRGGRGGFSDRGGRGGFDRGRGRGGPRGGRGGTTNRGGFGDFSGKKTSF